MTLSKHPIDKPIKEPIEDPKTPSQVTVEAIRQAASELGFNVMDVQAVSQRRTGVYRVHITLVDPVAVGVDGGEVGRVPADRSVVAARVVSIQDSLTPSVITHRVAHQLREAGAPVAAPLHPNSVATDVGPVGFWDWLHDTCIDPDAWGRLTGALHRAGQCLSEELVSSVGRYEPGRVFIPRLRRLHALTASPGHPLHGQDVLVGRFETALKVAIQDAVKTAASQGAPVLVHGDNQPGNVMAGPHPASGGSGSLLLNDLERVAVGPAAVDLAALVLGVQHYGYPAAVVDDFRTGYESGCGRVAPSVVDTLPFARIRELSGIAVAMLSSGDSPQAEAEMHARVLAIESPGGGRSWTYIGQPDATHLAGQPNTDPGHSCRAGPCAPSPVAGSEPSPRTTARGDDGDEGSSTGARSRHRRAQQQRAEQGPTEPDRGSREQGV